MDIPITECLCGHPFDPDQFMIQCYLCRIWYHGQCVSIKEYMATEIDKFHCPRCVPIHNQSIMKVRTNWHRHNYSEMEAEGKPVQTGTPVFIRELKSRHFPKADDIVKHLKGQQLTMQYLQTNGFDIPIIVDIKDGLDMVVPPPNFSLYDVQTYIGGEREMDVIDVAKQNNVRMSLKEFVEYYYDPNRSRILNVISLEFTNTGLSSMVEAPYIARKLDWVNYVWPRDWPEDSELKKPEVQKYCLMGVKDSFTDFHIDFGGTSVWYHVLRGEKVFYLIKPTAANLHLYQQWMSSSTQSETFFGDQVDACYKCVLKQGQTMLIPTGWIHAVLTPIDSLVFGGNFVHSLNIPMQIQIYEMERKLKTPAKFQYPGFETINWFAAKRLLKELKDLNSEEKKCPPYFLQGVKALLSILKQWNTDKDYSMLSRSQIPQTISSQKVLKDLSKEIRHAERYLIALNPPKPERESKRKKKKPMNKDFVDFHVTDRMSESSKLKSLAKEQSVKKETVSPKKGLVHRPPLKLTLPKPAAFPYHGELNSSVNAQERAIAAVAAPIKTIKTLSPKNTSVKKPNTSKQSSSHKSINAKRPAGVKKLTSEGKKGAKHGKQSPTVIRFKLGDNEVVRSTKDKGSNIYGNFVLDQNIETRKELTWKQTTSVYDFHDGSNESDYGGFTIDEAPKRKKSVKVNSTAKKAKTNFDVGPTTNTVPTNGIEELLKASVYTLDGTAPRLDVISDRASPSTRDAIAGMLSFSAQCYPTAVTPQQVPAKAKSKVAKARTKGTRPEKHELSGERDRMADDEDDLLIENMDKVHQDDDFIYPALDVSDEDEFMFKSKGKREEDEAWNPKARVGPLLPKTNRPAREGTKKTSVEKGLEAAAKKRARQSDADEDYQAFDDDDDDDDDDDFDEDMEEEKIVKRKSNSSKRTYKKKRKEQSAVQVTATEDDQLSSGVALPAVAPHDGNLTPAKSPEQVIKHIPYTSILTSPNRLKDVKAKLAAPIPVERKPKKGMKTAKQRLGKILKIHKMLH
ncbi:lysine-specific demethylase phf2-like isoform X3 [Phymastichus coffea]|uniref:lysine-specific demethylase phf2-like isoform X3 n=1 Tax=Phymastichus coffea TaxID=108790 RepID=UPI00273BEE43|nr:lysine-specific demethylase phf2-like isoform X3 [Phymastichus coffea]